jgi:hypothetical protein
MAAGACSGGGVAGCSSSSSFSPPTVTVARSESTGGTVARKLASPQAGMPREAQKASLGRS